MNIRLSVRLYIGIDWRGELVYFVDRGGLVVTTSIDYSAWTSVTPASLYIVVKLQNEGVPVDQVEVQRLTRFRQAVEDVPRMQIQVLTVAPPFIASAAALSQQTGLLSNDALIVAVMQANGLTNLASNDADFDRVPGLTRYAPL